MTTETPDRLNLRLRAMIALVGAILCIIGWIRYLS
jgi:hypothetical protein